MRSEIEALKQELSRMEQQQPKGVSRLDLMAVHDVLRHCERLLTEEERDDAERRRFLQQWGSGGWSECFAGRLGIL